jgi:hypothetical protein
MKPLVVYGLAAAFISPEMSLKERQAKLSPFFEPRPGMDLKVSDRAISLLKGDDYLLVKGEFWVRPPPGECLTLRKDFDEPDRRICRSTPLTWDIFDLDAAGNYNLLVIAGPRDEGTWLRWPTPYRVANYVPLGAAETEENYNVPIRSCQTSIVGDQRQITLTLMNGRRWFIYLPPFDTPTPKRDEPPPNLIVHVDEKADPTKATQSNQTKGSVVTEESEPKQRRSVLSQLLSGEYKKVKKAEFVFRVSRRNAFEMSSSGFMETSVPQGMNGRCRYKYEGAAGDPKSGVIECFNTDTFDAVYAHVTCFSEFAPRLDPNAKPEPKQGKEEKK